MSVSYLCQVLFIDYLLILTTTLKIKYYYPHLIYEETEIKEITKFASDYTVHVSRIQNLVICLQAVCPLQ